MEPPPENRSSTIHWGGVAVTALFLAALVVFLLVLRQWVLAGGMAGLTVGLGLIVAGQHREQTGRDGASYRRAGLLLLLGLTLAFFLSFLLRSESQRRAAEHGAETNRAGVVHLPGQPCDQPVESACRVSLSGQRSGRLGTREGR